MRDVPKRIVGGGRVKRAAPVSRFDDFISFLMQQRARFSIDFFIFYYNITNLSKFENFFF